MKLNRKALVLAAALAAVGSFAFAQGSSESAGSKTTQAAGPVHVTLWYPATQTEVGPLPNDWAGYQIIKDKFNIELEAQTLPSGTQDQDVKIQAAAAADDLPDMFTAGREVWLRLANNGMLADVTDLYARMPNRTQLMFDEGAKKYTTLNGRNYGFATPAAVSRNEGLVIRKDWLDKLGLEVPKTTDDLLKVLHAFTYDDPDGNGKKDTYGYGAFVETNNYEAYPGRRLEPLMGAFGVEGTWNMTKANFGLQINKPEFYDFMVFMKQIIDDGVIDPNWMAYKKDDFRGAWKQGKFGCFREQNSALHSENNYAPFDANFPNGDIIVIDPVTGPSGKASVGPAVRNMRVWCISAKAAEQGKAEKIADLFEWMSYGEGYMLCGFGREGVEYTLDANGNPQSVPGDKGYNGPVGQTYIQLRNMAFNYTSDMELSSRYPSYTTKVSGKHMSSLETLHNMQGRKWTDAVGMESMPVPSTDLKTFYEQGLAEFFSGKRELTKDNWNAFVKQFNDMGGKAWEEEGRKYAEANGLLK
ncbi:MAG: extracellular solute-binding protein [Spirochaetaceae bacterium]|nr:extracellular solute-binding protein [Spirochaetaceae bacterium]